MVAVSILAGMAYFMVPQYALGLVKDYQPYTFERVLEDDTMKINYGIYNNTSPIDYGFELFEEVTFASIQDNNQLSSWYVPASRSSKMTILLIHGRWSNRLKTMKYLELFKSAGLDTLYNVMIPDLRNSGRSQPATTMMGFEFAEDIATNMLWLANDRQQSDIILYGFSMGAMAIATLFNRDELVDEINASGINISKIILDSPVANVEKVLRRGGANSGLPEFILDRTMSLLDDEYDGFLPRMKFSSLFNDLQLPILILQGSGDVSQPTEILENELKTLKNKNLRFVKFEGAEHVRIYQDPLHRTCYRDIVQNFIYSR